MTRVAACSLVLLVLVRSATAIGPPIHTDTPITLGLEGRGVRSFVKVTRASVGDRQITTTAWPLIIPMQMSVKGVVGLAVPTLYRQLDGPGDTASSTGLGDVSIFAKYVVVQIDRPGQTLRLAPKIVVKLPTGDDKAGPALGSGSTDVSLGAVGAWLKGRLGLYAEGLWQRRGEAGQRDFGDGLRYNFALAYRALPAVYHTYPMRQANVYLELNGSWLARDQVAGIDGPDSGGHVLFVSPGAQFIPMSRLLLEASLQIPILRRLHGRQPEPDGSASLGLRVLLF